MAIQSFDFYVLRRHLLPIDGLFSLNENCPDVSEGETFLRQLFSQKTLGETLFIASQSLYHRFQAWLNGEEISEKNKLIQTLFKYYLRSCSRCTPYGLFAGCSIGEFFDETSITFDESKPFHKHIRLDTNYLVEIVNFLLSDENIKNQLRFYPNNTVYKVADRFHYLFYTIKDSKRSYAICSVDFSEYISLILEKAQSGCLIHELADLICNEEISKEEAFLFINQLIDEQLLLSEIEPTLTGDDFLGVLISKLSNLQINASIVDNLHKINNLLQNTDSKISDFEEIQTILSQFVSNNHKDFLQTDLFFNTKTNTISKAIINDLSQKFEKLLALNLGNHLPNLENFRRRFYERYEEAEIPLALVLDNETGIGYADFESNKSGSSPLIEDIKTHKQSVQNVFWNHWKQFTFKKYTKAIQNQDFEINLTDGDLDFLDKNFSEKRLNLPSSCYAFGSLFQDSGNLHFFYLKNLSGPSALAMLGRFGNGNEKLKEKLKECADYEAKQNEDVIYAEIVHLPEARIGNIASRPALRKYEIPYQTPSSQSPENQLLIEDLMISVRNGNKIILRSKKLNKQVIPRLSSAHNFEKGLSAYHFLADLQSADDCLNIFWAWHILSQQPFLPRVRYQNIILSPAIWNLKPDEFDFKKTEISISKLLEIREKLKIPRFVTISEADNDLWIDFENQLCLEILKEYCLKYPLITLKEVLSSSENCFLKTPNGSFQNELVIPLKITNYQPFKNNLENTKTLKRDFSIGSEWLYFKIYCGEKTADELLKNPIKNLVDELYANQIIDSFFFLRYKDPEHHIRLRFRGNSASFFYTHVISRLHEVMSYFQESKLIHQIQTDTYKREIERYGEKTMVLSEKLFNFDSKSVLDFISQSPNEEQRFDFALKRIDTYLEDFGLDFIAKKQFAEMMQKSFLNEFGEEQNRIKLNEKYRNLSKNLIGSFSGEDYFTLKPLSKKIISLLEDNQNRLFDLLSSYIHMFINRLFITNNRTYELMLYHFLLKIYIQKKTNVNFRFSS